jgi:hypothetical protein
MEIVIELTDGELLEVSGGAASASLGFVNTASGTNATVTSTLALSTTPSTATVVLTESSSSG